jgi:ParB family chromosome partitioning protein
MFTTRAIADIKIPERARRDLGDVDALAGSIATFGLLHQITIDATGNLLAGARRLAACKQLGWTEIPVLVVRIKPDQEPKPHQMSAADFRSLVRETPKLKVSAAGKKT